MKYCLVFIACIINLFSAFADTMPWSHGDLRVSPDGHYIEHADGTPFFLLGNTGWLLPEKSNRDEVKNFLDLTANGGYNVVLVQTLNDVPSINAYGQKSHVNGWDFANIDDPKTYGYWDHLDYIVEQARQRGIYIGMVCIWGGLVKSGKMDAEQAVRYGKFLTERYKNSPNIIWVIGGDIKGDVKPEVWNALASTIKENDPGHLMTYHPFGRTSSAYWWHDSEWLDFNMFQSGHRRYDQTRGDGDDTAQASVAEDNWRYVADGLSRYPAKPIIDGEPSYEDIPQGLHDTTQPRWTADDVRRYAYWSVFAGAAGHVYGHNSIMQMLHPGEAPAYGASKPWYEAFNDSGFNQIKHLKSLINRFSYKSRIPDQSVILSPVGNRYDRAISTRGDGYILVYTYTNQPLEIDLTKISGDTKYAYWFIPSDGTYEYIGSYPNAPATFAHDGPQVPGNDYVLIITASPLSF